MNLNPSSWSLAQWEAEIRRILGRHTVSECLRSLHAYGRELPSFQQAGFGMWAVKAGKPDQGIPSTGPYSKAVFDQEAVAVMNYLLKDPFGDGLDSSLSELILRIASSQFIFNHDGGEFGRAYLLWHELPPILAQSPRTSFDFGSAFESLHGADSLTFLKTCFVLFAVANAKNAFTGGYMNKAAQEGMRVPEETVMRKILKAVAAAPNELRILADQHKVPDRRFASYDFNPLLMYPIVQPWGRVDNFEEEGMIAGVPSLISYRVAPGVYYALFNHYQVTFSRYFGDLFEMYVGRVLDEFTNGEVIIGADVLLPGAPPNRKTPDWVVRCGDVAVVIECKATKFNRTAQQTGATAAIDDSLKQVRGGIVQCSQFIDDCLSGARIHRELSGVIEFVPVVVTWEPMPTINSHPMQDNHLPEAKAAKCVILSVQDLERLQMRSKRGLDFAATLKDIQMRGEYQVFGELDNSSPATHEDSFLVRYDELLFRGLLE